MARKNKRPLPNFDSSKYLPWNGDISEAELKMPGGALIGALKACAGQRGHNLDKLSTNLGVKYCYISQLRSGIRHIDCITDWFARSCAQYLKVSVVRVMLLAGKLEPKDFHEPVTSYEGAVGAALDQVARDPRLGGLVTTAVRDGSADAKHSLVRLYEEATGKVLLPVTLAAS